MNKPIKEIDIFQRTLKCKDIPLEDQEIEIFEVESTEVIAEEEEIPVESETEIDPEALYVELECVKRQLQKLLLLLKTLAKPAQPSLEANCVEEAEICALQKAHHKLQCEIHELTRCFRLIRNELRQLHSYFCVETKEMELLWSAIAFFKYWRNAMEPDEEVCHFRFKYLQCKKANWKETQAKMLKKKRCPELMTARYLTKADFYAYQIFLQAELERLKRLFVDLFEMKGPNYADEYAIKDRSTLQPMKQIEMDYIKRQIELNRALQDRDCKEYFKCDKITWI